MKRKRVPKWSLFALSLRVIHLSLLLTGLYTLIGKWVASLPCVKQWAFGLMVKGFFSQWGF